MTEPLALPSIPPLTFTIAITVHQDIPSVDHAALQAQFAALLYHRRSRSDTLICLLRRAIMRSSESAGMFGDGE